MLTLDCPNVFGRSCFPSVFTVEGCTANRETTPKNKYKYKSSGQPHFIILATAVSEILPMHINRN